MQLTIWLEDRGPVLWYISIVLLYIGYPRRRSVWIQASLAQILYQWNSVLNMFEVSTITSEWWGSHVRVPPISQVTTNLSRQTRPSRIQPWIRSHRASRIILSVRDPHEMSGGHYMSILMTMRQISSPSYFPPVKSEKVLSKTLYTISFRGTHWRLLSHGVWTNTMIVCTTPKIDSGCRTIRTTICWILSFGRATFIFLLYFYLLKIIMPTWYLFCFIFLPKEDVTHMKWATKTLLYVFISKLFHSPRPWSTWEECLILPSLRRIDGSWF